MAASSVVGLSEMLGNPLSFSGAACRSAPTPIWNPTTFKMVALFSKKKAPKSKPASAVSPAKEELAKWYGREAISGELRAIPARRSSEVVVGARIFSLEERRVLCFWTETH